MIRRLAAALCILLSWPPALAAAEPLPTLFDVRGVAAGDRLNIRERPDAKSRVIGTIAPDARGVEVVAERSGWAMVNTAERAGWVNGRYLARRAGVWTRGQLPPTLSCAGNEPFWSLRQVGARLVYETPGNARALDRRAVLDDGNAASPLRAVTAGDAQGGLTLVIQPAACSDGMSDRNYGLSAVVLFDAEGQPGRLRTGCCRIAP